MTDEELRKLVSDTKGLVADELFFKDDAELITGLSDAVLTLLDRVETAERERDEYRDGTTIVKLTAAEQALQRVRDRHKPHRDTHKPDPGVIQANWFCCGAVQLGLIAPTDCDTCGVDYPCPEIQALEGDE